MGVSFLRAPFLVVLKGSQKEYTHTEPFWEPNKTHTSKKKGYVHWYLGSTPLKKRDTHQMHVFA